MSVKIYHNPRCSKSRETLKIIEDAGIKVEIVEYLKNPLSIYQVKELLCGLAMEPRQAMRIKEDIYKELDLGNEDKSDYDLIKAIADNPILLERPIVVTEKGCKICRPPELVEALI